uniref:Peptidase A1 domain-containing protein n=1 Tax=Acrobeloides nanus TaxID=290746 RepID=A0A914E0C4_9BILA
MRSAFVVLSFLALFIIAESRVVLPLRHHSSKNVRSKPSKLTSPQSVIDYFDDFYSVSIMLGTPPQKLIVRLDTSSSNLWIMDKNSCTAQQCLGFPSLTSNFNRTLFNSTASNTYTLKNTNFTTPDALCLTGVLGNDKLMISGFGAISQDFGLCSVVDKYMGLHPFDGFLGLAWPALAIDGAIPIVQNQIAAGHFDQPVFSLYYGTSGVMLSNDGQITWGGIDTTNCDSNIQYVPLSSKTYWQFTFNSFTFGSFSINKSQQVISSSGDAVFVVPSNVLSTIVTILNATHEVFDDDGQWALPCNMSSTFPDLVYTINGQVYRIKGSDYIEPEDNHNTCALRIEDGGMGGFGPQWVLGVQFIRNYCHHYDVGNARIGFSKPLH